MGDRQLCVCAPAAQISSRVQGVPDALFELGVAFHKGIGVQQVQPSISRAFSFEAHVPRKKAKPGTVKVVFLYY